MGSNPIFPKMPRETQKSKLRKKVRILWDNKNPFYSFWDEKLVKCLIKKGKKELVMRAVISGLIKLKHSTTAPSFLFLESFELVRPVLTLTLHRKGGQHYQVPFVTKKYNQYNIGIKWLAEAILKSKAKVKGSKNLKSRFVTEIFDTANKQISISIKRQQVLYLVATENRAVSHYRWQ